MGNELSRLRKAIRNRYGSDGDIGYHPLTLQQLLHLIDDVAKLENKKAEEQERFEEEAMNFMDPDGF